MIGMCIFYLSYQKIPLSGWFLRRLWTVCELFAFFLSFSYLFFSIILSVYD